MIEKIRVRGYRKFNDLLFFPEPGLNILVGDNESGKSTIVEALNLALTGRINGRPAREELNPYWFNRDVVREYFTALKSESPEPLPEISIELFFRNDSDLQSLVGAYNSDVPTRSCPGVVLIVEPDPEFKEDLAEYLESETTLLPVEYYRVVWRHFGDQPMTQRPKALTSALIDARTIRSSSGVDYHLRQMMSDHLEPKEKARISVAYRGVKEQMTTTHLLPINEKMAELDSGIDSEKLALAMDQSSDSSWDVSVSPYIDDLPFSMAGLGQQVTVKIALAMDRHKVKTKVVSIEEPENHLSFTSLTKLVKRLEELSGSTDQQLFITTHSSFVLNRLGLSSLTTVSNGKLGKLAALKPETVSYFQKLPGYDTLRLILARKTVLVEGPSDEIVFERFYADAHEGRRPLDDGIDVLSMRGLSLGKCFELAKAVDATCIALRDNDGIESKDIITPLTSYFAPKKRALFVGTVAEGRTLEPQIVLANSEAAVRSVLGVSAAATLDTWMKNNKTEGALRIAESETVLAAPNYMKEAITFLDAE